ncbi:MAG: hypothetical protein WC375_06485 [Methanomassiliicoccales archaeon]|jgi:hypothetical protein
MNTITSTSASIEIPEDIIEVKGKVPDGSAIQRDLETFLKQFTPWVSIESTSARYDAIAYVNEMMPIEGLKKNQVVPCNLAYRRCYCREQWDALCVEARNQASKLDVPWQAHDRIRARDDLSDETKDAILNRPMMLLGQTWYKDSNELWKEYKDSVRCEVEDCPSYVKYVKSRQEWERDHHFEHIGIGIHIFEVKSDKDTWDRLAWQIPEMLEFADYVWLVIGEHMEIPEWLPPFIGVLRHKDHRFIKERDTTGIKKSPSTYWQVLKDHGIREDKAKIMAVGMHRIRNLLKDWMINSTFFFEGWQVERGCIVDMSHDLEWFDTMLLRLKEEEERLLKMSSYELHNLKGEAREERMTIVAPRRQRSIESFFDESFKEGE